jgi:hypothetical protein
LVSLSFVSDPDLIKRETEEACEKGVIHLDLRRTPALISHKTPPWIATDMNIKTIAGFQFDK